MVVRCPRRAGNFYFVLLSQDSAATAQIGSSPWELTLSPFAPLPQVTSSHGCRIRSVCTGCTPGALVHRPLSEPTPRKEVGAQPPSHPDWPTLGAKEGGMGTAGFTHSPSPLHSPQCRRQGPRACRIVASPRRRLSSPGRRSPWRSAMGTSPTTPSTSPRPRGAHRPTSPVSAAPWGMGPSPRIRGAVGTGITPAAWAWWELS